MDYYKNKEVLIIGGTGSLGKTLLKLLKRNHNPRGIRIFSRDETKQWELCNEMQEAGLNMDRVARLLGDVRDLERLRRAFAGVDIVIHCAAQKHVPSCEDNPMEAIKTNVMGAANVVDAALDAGVQEVVFISTDKAVYPINLYGCSKAVAEKVILDANVYRGKRFKTKFSVMRYGNVLGSRGSIIPLFRALDACGKPIPITDERMTRFFIRLPEVAQFILDRIPEIESGEIFVPKMKGTRITEMARMICPDARQEIVGIRPGEKLHECLISEEEARWKLEDRGQYFVIHNTNRPENKDARAYTSEQAAAENTLQPADIKNLYI
jgi:UDP-N-acetylglucosamine 4,6-dehydratase